MNVNVKNGPRVTLGQGDFVGCGGEGRVYRKGDTAYDRALELDGEHWRARFNKAISLSFWPAALGKQPEAIKHFEILVDQQGSGRTHPGHPETHYYLGNMYLQMGDREKAIATWEAGLAKVPDHENLRKQIDAARR